MRRDEALQVCEGDWLYCDFFHPEIAVQVQGVNPNASSQERITFEVQAGKHGLIWLDAGWFRMAKAQQLALEGL